MGDRLVVMTFASLCVLVACGGGKAEDKAKARSTPQGFCTEKLTREDKENGQRTPSAERIAKCADNIASREAKMPGYLACSGACLDEAALVMSEAVRGCFEKCTIAGQKRAMEAGAKTLP